MTRREYSDEDLLDQMRLVKEENGKVTPRLFNAHEETASSSLIMRRFSSWTDAKQEAGIHEDLSSETGRERQYSDEDVLAHIRECADRNDGKCTVRLLQAEDDLITPSVAVSRFGSWQKAKKKAGLDVDERSGNSRPREYTDEDYLEYIRKCYEKYGKATQRKFNEEAKENEDHPTAGAIRKRFGSWSAAKEEAGINSETRTYTDDELIKQLRECKERHGRASANVFASDDDFASPETIQRRFGTWEEGKEEANIN